LFVPGEPTGMLSIKKPACHRSLTPGDVFFERKLQNDESLITVH
jgi:hypothetical protein